MRRFGLALVGVVCLTLWWTGFPALAADLSGRVEAVPPGGVGPWVVSGVPVEVTPATKIKLKGPLAPGRAVRLKGYYAPDGRFVATEIKAKKAKKGKKHW
ncbi:MAG: DUF5666 domain-containing protein [Syntrophobacterales bacterium]|nr:DUF5666 domain-containing protein [Syntrophobacterales bacterium]